MPVCLLSWFIVVISALKRAEIGVPGDKGQPGLRSNFRVSLGHMRVCLKTREKKKKMRRRKRRGEEKEEVEYTQQ